MTDDELIRKGDALEICESHGAAAMVDPACDHCGMDPSTIREAALREAINVCKVMQTKAKTNAAWLHACEIEEAILALITEKPHDRP